MQDHGGPLEGLRVLDLSRIVSGPFATRVLADLGASVVKVEPPQGDITRSVEPTIDGVPVYFTQMNAGKRSVCLDLKVDGAAELVRRIARRSDVLVENFRPGVLERLGLGVDHLRRENPRLIVCSISGWGQHGPWAQRSGHAPMMHAEAGWIEMAARLRNMQPLTEVSQHADLYAALLAANAVLAAVHQRSRTGEGCHIDLNMGRSTTYVNDWAAIELLRWEGARAPFDTWNFRVFTIADGTAVAFGGDPVDRFEVWADLFREFGLDVEVLGDPRFATRESRVANVDALVVGVQSVVAQIPDRRALEAILDRHPTLGSCCQSLADLAETEWARDAGLVADADVAGVPLPAAPWTVDNAYVGVRGPAPVAGADNAAVLAELADVDDAELTDLIERGAVSFGGGYELIIDNVAPGSPIPR